MLLGICEKMNFRRPDGSFKGFHDKVVLISLLIGITIILHKNPTREIHARMKQLNPDVLQVAEMASCGY